MESSLDRENSQGTTRTRVADDTVHKHGTQEVSSTECPAAAGSSVRGAQEHVSSSERLEEDFAHSKFLLRERRVAANSLVCFTRLCFTPYMCLVLRLVDTGTCP